MTKHLRNTPLIHPSWTSTLASTHDMSEYLSPSLTPLYIVKLSFKTASSFISTIWKERNIFDKVDFLPPFYTKFLKTSYQKDILIKHKTIYGSYRNLKLYNIGHCLCFYDVINWQFPAIYPKQVKLSSFFSDSKEGNTERNVAPKPFLYNYFSVCISLHIILKMALEQTCAGCDLIKNKLIKKNWS